MSRGWEPKLIGAFALMDMVASIYADGLIAAIVNVSMLAIIFIFTLRFAGLLVRVALLPKPHSNVPNSGVHQVAGRQSHVELRVQFARPGPE